MPLGGGPTPATGRASPGGGLGSGIDYTSGESGLDKLLHFGLSTVESFPEMFGIEPSDTTQAFRVTNPVSGFVSQLVGGIVPYAGEAKLLRMIPTVERGVMAARAAGAVRGPALGLAAETAAEAGAVGVANTALAATPIPGQVESALTGEDKQRTESLSSIALGNAFNTVAAGALGGAAGLIGKRLAAGRQLSDVVPGFHKESPVLEQIRTLTDTLAAHNDPANPLTLPDETAARIDRARNMLINYNLQDKVPSFTTSGDITDSGIRTSDQGKVYRSLVGEKKTREISSFMNNTLKVSDRPSTITTTQRLVVDPAGGFRTEADLQSAVDRIGVPGELLGTQAQDIKLVTVRAGTGARPAPVVPAAPADFDLAALGKSQTPGQAVGRRLLSSEPVYNKATSTDQALGRANGIQRRFTATPFKSVGDGFRMAQDTDGMWVFNKKIAGDINKAAPGDQWVMFRTDRPDLFAPRAAKTDAILMRSAYFPTEAERLVSGEPLFDSGNAFAKLLGGDNILAKDVRQRGKFGALLRDSAGTIGSKAAPSGPYFETNPLANYAWKLAKALEAHAEMRINSLMNGRIKFDPKKSVFRNMVGLTPDHEEGLAAMIKTFAPADLHDIKSIVESETPFERVRELHAAGHISDNAHNFLAGMQALSDNFVERVEKVSAKLAGNDAMKLLGTMQARKGHYMLTREYPGAYRMFLYDEKHNLVGFASEKSPLEVQTAAAKIIEDQAKRGANITAGGMMDEALLDPHMFSQLKNAVMKPGFLKNRGDLIGYEFARGDLTNKKLTDLVDRNLRRRENYLRDIAVLEHTANPLAQLYRQNPQMAVTLQAALGRMRGDEGDFGRTQNRMLDTLVHAVGLSGKDSATNIIKTTQKTMSAFQFGFNLCQPIQNMVGALQTILPEMAYLVHADPATLARNYVSLPLMDSANNVKGTLGVISEFKLFKNALDRLATPLGKQPQDYQQLLQDMTDARVINGRLTEEQFGLDGYVLSHPREAFKQGHSIMDVVSAASTLLMTKSEELNRTLALNAAYEIGTARGMKYDQLRVFAMDFIHKTQYNYATHDRAPVFTTPVGSLMGTFKNWMFHYLGSMIKYSTAGPAGMRALAYQTAVTGIFGGAAAMPLVLPITNAASKWMSNKSAMQNLYDTTIGLGLPEQVADGVMYGLPGSLGLSLSSQVSSPASDPVRDASMLFSFAAMDRVKALSSATKDALVAYKVTGQNPFQSESVRNELVRALAPRTIYRAMSIGQNQAIHSMATGYDVARLGVGGALMYSAGFNPTELEKTYAAYGEIRDNQRAKQEMVQQFGESLAEAWESGDDRMASRVFTRALATGVDTSSVLRSAQSRQLRGQKTQLEFVASPEDQSKYQFEFNNSDDGGQ